MNVNSSTFLLVVIVALAAVVVIVIVAMLAYDLKRKKPAPSKNVDPRRNPNVRPDRDHPAEEAHGSMPMPAGPAPVLEWEDHGKRQTATINKVPFTVGRASGSSRPPDVDLGRGASEHPDMRVSRRHAIFKYETNCFWVCDNESKNGLILNERILEPKRWYRLRDFDNLQLADFEIRFRHGGSLEEIPIIDGYEVHELLGKGGMAAVFRAHTRGSDGAFKMRAIKVPIQYGDDDESAERRLSEEFATIREIGNLKIAQAKHVVRAVEEGRTRAGKRFVSLECLEGGTLKDYLRASGGTFDEATAANAALQIALGLQALEAVHKVHCDVKLDNVLFRHQHAPGKPLRGDELRLIDFGIARKVNSAIKNPFGAANYMSPEHIIGQVLNNRSDVYSLGCVIYEMISGSKLFPEAENAAEIKAKQLSETPKSLAKRVYEQKGRHITDDMNALVMRMLEKPNSSRPSLDDVVHKLESFARLAVK